MFLDLEIGTLMVTANRAWDLAREGWTEEGYHVLVEGMRAARRLEARRETWATLLVGLWVAAIHEYWTRCDAGEGMRAFRFRRVTGLRTERKRWLPEPGKPSRRTAAPSILRSLV